MRTVTFELDVETARLVRDAAQAEHQPVEDWLKAKLHLAAAHAMNGVVPAADRKTPLHPGMMEITPEFHEPLEEFATHL